MKKTIKIIDLFNMIANNQQPPVYIKYMSKEYKLDYIGYKEANYLCNGMALLEGLSTTMCLNDEVEIIEEDKKIKKIKSLNNVGNCQNLVEFGDKQQLNNHILKDKINEIIDAINELKKSE